MKTIRVLMLFVMGASAFCGFAQDGAPKAGAPASGAVMLNRKSAPTKQEVVPTDKYPFAALQKLWSKVQAQRLARLPRA